MCVGYCFPQCEIYTKILLLRDLRVPHVATLKKEMRALDLHILYSHTLKSLLLLKIKMFTTFSSVHYVNVNCEKDEHSMHILIVRVDI
jgi:hypothetical protein